MDFNNLLCQQTADLTILLQDTFTAIIHNKDSINDITPVGQPKAVINSWQFGGQSASHSLTN